MTNAPYVSRVPCVEERRKTLELHCARAKAREALDAAEAAADPNIEAKFKTLHGALSQDYDQRFTEIERQRDAELGLTELRAAQAAAEEADDAFDGPALRYDSSHPSRIAHCALTGLPITMGDEILDGETKSVIRTAVLGPRIETAFDPTPEPEAKAA